MNKIKRVLFILAIALVSSAYSSSAQIVVRVRPDRPHYERPVAPGPRHVWIDEDWTPRGNTYVFNGGRWAEPPHERAHWVPGHWKETPNGYVWREGHWSRR